MVPAIFSVSKILSSFARIFANAILIRCVSPKIIAIFLSCSFESMVTKLASGNRFFATVNSFFPSLIGIDIIFWFFTPFAPGPNIG